MNYFLFWENITRYPRFFITSFTGLCVILLQPLVKLAKKNTVSRIFLIVFSLFVFGTLFLVLQSMLDL
jgi:hypothetical protein